MQQWPTSTLQYKQKGLERPTSSGQKQANAFIAPVYINEQDE